MLLLNLSKFFSLLCCLWEFFQALAQRHIWQINCCWRTTGWVPFLNVDSNLESLCERKKNEKLGSEFGRKALHRSGLKPGDLAGTIRHCGVWTERDLWQMRAGERGPPLRKTVHKAPFTTQVPSATCGAREGLQQRPSTRPIGCKISSHPSWIELRKWEIPKRRRMRGEREKKHGRKKPEDSPWNCLSVGQSQQGNSATAVS